MASAAGGQALGSEMHAFASLLYPICRSITGDGVRQTLEIIGREIPLTVHEVPSGTPVFDWTVPPEWNVRDAYVADASGARVIDFRRHTLHVVSYSMPVRTRLSRADLDAHLHSLPEHPDWIPYRTSYYDPSWGFCVTHRQRQSLPDGDYDVVIDATLEPGRLTYGECVLPGEIDDEILISCHVCHPSLANDNLSGIALATSLARRALERPRRHTLRVLFIPGTIGSLTWLARHEPQLARIAHGLVVTCVGDAGSMTYKKSRRGDAEIDRAVRVVLQQHGRPFTIEDFIPWGYDERQYCSPAFNLPVGCLMRTPNGRYPEYHTSADNLDLLNPEALAESLNVYEAVLATLDGNARYRNLSPKGEPQLGKRGLYAAMGQAADARTRQLAMLWVLNYSDGAHALLDIAERSGLSVVQLRAAADLLSSHGLLAREPDQREAA